MCSDSNLTKLHRLIDDSLRPYTEPDVVSVTKEREILVSLSQVLRQVKLWIGEVDSDSDNIVLLTVESQYVKHLACNVLAAVSEFVAASEELLRQSIPTLEFNQEDCLEGSPFLSSVYATGYED